MKVSAFNSQSQQISHKRFNDIRRRSFSKPIAAASSLKRPKVVTLRPNQSVTRLKTEIESLQKIITSLQEQLQLLSSVNSTDRPKLQELEQLQQTLKKLEQLVHYDHLTGILNKRRFDELINQYFTSKDDRIASLLEVDVDFFKRYNDTYGHPAGDIALRAVAFALKISVRRPVDVVARSGGEEFSIFLQATDKQGAILVAENVQKNLDLLVKNFGKLNPDGSLSTDFLPNYITEDDRQTYRQIVEDGLKIDLRSLEHQASEVSKYLTLSIGIAEAHTKQNTPSELIKCADTHLYAAKNGGRNRISASNKFDLPCHPIQKAVNYLFESGCLALGLNP